MPRFLSLVVLVSAGALVPAHALAQAPPASGPERTPSAPAAAPSTPKTAAQKPPVSKPSAAKPSVPDNTASPNKKPDDHLSDEAELSRVVGLYEAGKYRECGTEIERLLDPTGRTPLRQVSIVENARVYWAACLLGAGDSDGADAPLRAAIHENPQMKAPDSLVFPQLVVDRFLKVRDSLVSEIRAAEQTRIKQAQEEARQRRQTLERDRERMLALEKLARQETLVVRNRRSFAYIPFGVGQFQNRQPALGYTLLVSEALFATAFLTAVTWQSRIANSAEEQRRAGNKVDAQQQDDQKAAWGAVKRVSFWALAGAAVGGVLQANVDFVPEFRETRVRPLPLSLSRASTSRPSDVSAVPYVDTAGGGFVLSGHF